MRLDRYQPEARRRRDGAGRNTLLIVGIVLAIHLFAAAGWTAIVAIRERNAPPRLVVRFFDIATFPPAPTKLAAEEPRYAIPSETQEGTAPSKDAVPAVPAPNQPAER